MYAGMLVADAVLLKRLLLLLLKVAELRVFVKEVVAVGCAAGRALVRAV